MAQGRRVFPPIDFKTRFPALDGVRALAITLVFLNHYGGGGTRGGTFLKLLNAARIRMGVGVDIFFVLSGFLITGILYDTVNDSHFFKRFFARRSLRIFPLMYLLFAVIALLTPVLGYVWHPAQAFFLVYLGNFFANADFSLYAFVSPGHPFRTAEIGHLWSLCVEEQFYLLWPLVVWWVRDRRKLMIWAAALCGLTLTFRIAMVLSVSPEIAERWIIRTLPFRLDGLLFGALLALALRGPAADRVQKAMKWLFLGAMAVTLALMVLSPEYTSPWYLTVGLTLIGLGGMGLIGWTLDPHGWAARIFSWQPAKVLGKYSYGFYVWHVVWAGMWLKLLIYLMDRLHSTVLGGIVTLGLCFAATFVVSKLSYDLFEVRFLKYKRHFEYDSELRTHRTAMAADGR